MERGLALPRLSGFTSLLAFVGVWICVISRVHCGFRPLSFTKRCPEGAIHSHNTEPKPRNERRTQNPSTRKEIGPGEKGQRIYLRWILLTEPSAAYQPSCLSLSLSLSLSPPLFVCVCVSFSNKNTPVVHLCYCHIPKRHDASAPAYLCAFSRGTNKWNPWRTRATQHRRRPDRASFVSHALVRMLTPPLLLTAACSFQKSLSGGAAV